MSCKTQPPQNKVLSHPNVSTAKHTIQLGSESIQHLTGRSRVLVTDTSGRLVEFGKGKSQKRGCQNQSLGAG